MEKNRLGICLLAVISTAIITATSGPDPRTVAVMPFVASGKNCAPCHHEDSPEAKNPARACDTFCRRCHSNMGMNHHPLAVRTRKETNGMDLTLTGRVACFTCHNLEVKRFDSEPWRAMSLFDNMFHKQKEYPTYFLPVRNTDGELCKKCH